MHSSSLIYRKCCGINIKEFIEDLQSSRLSSALHALYALLGVEVRAGRKQVSVRDNNIVNNIVKHLRAASS